MIVTFYVKFFIFFQCLPLRRSAGFREKQLTGTTSPSPACLMRDPQYLSMNGRATVSKTLQDNFHLRQLKVGILILVLKHQLWQVAGEFDSHHQCQCKECPIISAWFSLRFSFVFFCRGWSSISLQYFKRHVWFLHLHINKSNWFCQLQLYFSCDAW